MALAARHEMPWPRRADRPRFCCTVRVGRVEFPQPEGARFLLSLHCSCGPRWVGATAILCSVKCSPVRDTLNLSIYLSIFTPARAAACRASSRRAAARRSPRAHRAAACRTAACRTAARRLGRRMSGDDHRFGVWSPGVSPFPPLPTDPCRYSSLVAAASGAAKHRTQSRHLEVLLEAFD